MSCHRNDSYSPSGTELPQMVSVPCEFDVRVPSGEAILTGTDHSYSQAPTATYHTHTHTHTDTQSTQRRHQQGEGRGRGRGTLGRDVHCVVCVCWWIPGRLCAGVQAAAGAETPSALFPGRGSVVGPPFPHPHTLFLNTSLSLCVCVCASLFTHELRAFPTCTHALPCVAVACLHSLSLSLSGGETHTPHFPPTPLLVRPPTCE